jgi:hypothetical protein
MSSDRSEFLGTWNLYSGQTCCEMILNADASYLQSVWGGAQRVWGNWGVEDYFGQAVLALTAQGSDPAVFLNQFGTVPVVERYRVTSVEANQIHFCDALLVRQHLSSGQQPVSSIPVSAAVSPPADTHPAPASAAPPPAHTTPVLNQFKAANTQVGRIVSTIQAQVVANHPGPDPEIVKMYDDLRQYKRDAAKKLADDALRAQRNSNIDFLMSLHGFQRIGG